MTFDFDTPLSLRQPHIQKWGTLEDAFGMTSDDAIPMWVADMDFAAAPAIRAVVQDELDRGYFGYFGDRRSVDAAITDWLKTHHGWDLDPSAIRYTHGVVAGFAHCLATLSQPGDGVVLFSPVYHAFYRKARHMGREIVESPLVIRDGQYHMDLDALAASLTGREKILAFCSPHNPGGRVWTADEIRTLVKFCETHDLVMISDEIHMDLTYPGVQHIPTVIAAPSVKNRLITLTAATKGFNIAGIETGLMIVEDDNLRAEVDKVHADRGGSPNRFGMRMTEAAFTHGADWSVALRIYIAQNFAIWRDRIGAIPGVSVMDMQATYLAWVDFSGTGMTPAEVRKRCVDVARIAPSPGRQFGTGGEGWNRFNIAMPRSIMMEAIERMEDAFSDLQ